MAKKATSKTSPDTYHREVYLVDGARTPFLKATGLPGPYSASDLATIAAKHLLLKQNFLPQDIEHVILGCVGPSSKEANIARLVSLRIGCSKETPAYTVQRNCASGLQAIDNAALEIAAGRSELILAGGTESMSHAPLQFNSGMQKWFSSLYKAKSIGQKLATLVKFKPYFIKPVITLKNALTDHTNGLGMGQTAEIVSKRFNISREDMDRFAQQSHEKAVAAQKDGILYDEIVPMLTSTGSVYENDTGPRPDSSLERLQQLRPAFDRNYGLVTAGNSSQISDGAAIVILASADAVKKYKLKPMARLVNCQWSGCEPAEMGLGPAHAISDLLTKQKLKLADIDCFEINEAFAGQVIACLEAWQDEEYCKNELKQKKALGTINADYLNMHGGAIAIGHPVGASGARLLLHLARTLNAQKKQRGIASLCIGGGQGGAMLIENEMES